MRYQSWWGHSSMKQSFIHHILNFAIVMVHWFVLSVVKLGKQWKYGWNNWCEMTLQSKSLLYLIAFCTISTPLATCQHQNTTSSFHEQHDLVHTCDYPSLNRCKRIWLVFFSQSAIVGFCQWANWQHARPHNLWRERRGLSPLILSWMIETLSVN